MITALTIENLIKLGLNKQRATELFNGSNEHDFQGKEGNFYLLDNKVYTDIDYYRMTCFNRGSIRFPLNCPDLIDEYFNLSLNKYLLEQKEVLKSIFVAEDQKKKFISKDILNAKNRIENQKVMLKKLPHFGSERKENAISILEAYINFCETKLKQPQQPEDSKHKKVLFDFIYNIEDKEAFVSELKTVFNTGKGKPIKAVINILKEAEMLTIPDREFKTFYNLLKLSFDRDIGTYTGINDAEKIVPFDNKYLEPIKIKLNPLIIKYKTT